MTTLPRTLNPGLNPTGYMATAGAVYAGTLMIYNVVNHHGAWSTPVFISLVGAVAALLARGLVTPVADPVDGAGRPLVPAAPPPEATWTGHSTVPLNAAGAQLGALNTLRADAGLPPLPPQSPGQGDGTSAVIIEHAPEPPAPSGND